jgi:hypothetical protein
MSNDERYLEDITRLASIPNRGPATAGEKQAAEYVASRMTEMGLNPKIEPFPSIPHFPICWVIHSVLCICACGLAFVGPLAAIAAAIILVFVTVSFVGDSSTRFYLIRRLLPTSESRSVVGILKAKGTPKKVIYIAAHLDAGQMGFSLNPEKAEPTARFFKKYIGIQPPLLALIFYVMILNTVAALIVGFHGVTLFTAAFLLVTAAIHIIPIVIFTPHEFAKISPGANDNAAGVAVVLDLARRFKDHPLPNTELRFLDDGSEETYMYGMACFMNMHQHELDKKNTYFLVPESCGNGTPRVVMGEGVSWIERHNPELCNLLLASAKGLGYTEVEPVTLRTGGTDMSPPTVRGFKASGIICMNENDYVPNYHWNGDLPENVQIDTVRRVTSIFEAAIKKIDAEF